MYKVMTKIFGKYTETGYADTLAEAKKIAEEESDRGWIYVQIELPNGHLTQEYGWLEESKQLIIAGNLITF